MARDSRQPDPRPDGWERKLPSNIGVVDERQPPASGSNGGLDIMTPFFMHRQRRLADDELARVELAAIAAGKYGPSLATLDLADPGRPVWVKPCRGCQATMRIDLWVELPSGGVRLCVSPAIFAMAGMRACADCVEREEVAVAQSQLARDVAARMAASGIEAALAADAAKGWSDIIVRARSADERSRRVEARDVLRAWAENPDPSARGVWLHGPAGSGKTKAVATAAVEKLKLMPVRWVSVAVLIMQLDGAWNDDERQAALKFLTHPGVVVLDDADKVTPSVRVQLALFTALEARDKAGSGILVTTNEPPSELAKTFSSPMMSRLVKLAAPMAYPGPDMRLEIVS